MSVVLILNADLINFVAPQLAENLEAVNKNQKFAQSCGHQFVDATIKPILVNAMQMGQE